MAAKHPDPEPAPDVQLATYVDRLPPAIRERLVSVRATLRQRFPTANELAYDYTDALVIGFSPNQQGIDSIVALRASAAGVSLYFNQGPKLPDPQRRLRGSGKQTRYVVLEGAAPLDDPDVQALIAATIAQARIPFPATGSGSLVIKSSAAKKRPRRPAA